MRTIPLCILAASSPLPAALAQPIFQPLGFAPGEQSSMALAIAADGSTVAGTINDLPGGSSQGWYWRPTTGMVLIPGGKGRAVTDDGSAVIGPYSTYTSFRYTIDPPIQFILPPPGPYGLTALGASGDGHTIVGLTQSGASTGALTWHEATGYFTPPHLPNTNSGIVYAATPDGSMFVGDMWNSANGAGSAFTWTSATGSVALGTLDPNVVYPRSGAYDVSPNGVVVGYGKVGLPPPSFDYNYRPFRWTSANGMQDLGVPPGATGDTRATAVSDDGSVVVGFYQVSVAPSSPVTRAFIWDAASGIRDLRSYLVQLGANGEIFSWTLNKATGISADGRHIVGWGVDGQGRYQAFLATIPTEPCYPNCDGSTAPPVLNVLDFNCFLNRFGAGDTYSNCDGSTEPPVLNVLDFNCFINRFTLGC